MNRAEEIAWYKAHGICPVCRREQMQRGFQTCLACRMNMREYKAAKKAEMTPEEISECNALNNERVANMREKRKAMGLCVTCGKRKADSGMITCKFCRAAANKKHREWYARRKGITRRERMSGYVCYKCCKPIENTGDVLCEDCRKKQSEIMRRVNVQKRVHAGTKLYCVIPAEPGEHDAYVCEDICTRREDNTVYIVDGEFPISFVGERWFLDRKEAEKRLEESRNE